MQSLAPSNAEEGDKIGSNLASVSCHASTAPLKPNHVESHGDKKKGFEDKKPLSLPLRKNTNLIKKPINSTRRLEKPEIPACIEACDVSSLLDKFLEYELDQKATVNMAKNSSVALTPVSSPSHKSSCNLTEALNANKKLCVSSTIGLTPPVSPPSNQSVHPTKSSPTLPSTPVTTHDKSKEISTLPTRKLNDSKQQSRNAENGSSMEKVTLYCKAPSDVTMNNIKNKTSMQLTTSTTQQNVTSKTSERSRNDSCHGNEKVVEKPRTNNGSEPHISQETKTSSHQFLQEKNTKLPKSPVDRKVNGGDRNLKRCYSSDDDDDDNDKDYYDYKRKKCATKDECYWSTSEDESDDERRSYRSRKWERRENSSRRRRRSHSSSDSDDNHSSYGKSRRHTSDHKQQRRKDTESKEEKNKKEAPVYDIEMERKKIFKLDRNFKETATEKRKIVYVGNIKESMTKDDVWRRFREYGPIEKVTVHYRNDGDNYSFVTFIDSSSALEAIEEGSKDPDLKHLDICFGGRRKFCGGSYVDFDSNTSYLEEKQMNGDVSSSQSKGEAMDFDALLKMCQKKSR